MKRSSRRNIVDGRCRNELEESIYYQIPRSLYEFPRSPNLSIASQSKLVPNGQRFYGEL